MITDEDEKKLKEIMRDSWKRSIDGEGVPGGERGPLGCEFDRIHASFDRIHASFDGLSTSIKQLDDRLNQPLDRLISHLQIKR